jgi:hypothetical protein
MNIDLEKTVERLLEAPYWVIDMLPMQVPQGNKGQFFAVEQYFLQEPQHERLCRQFADVLLKLNCYHDLHVNHDNKWIKNPEPATLVAWLTENLRHGHLCILVDDGDALITASGGDIYMTLYNPSEDLLELTRQLASESSLFLWQPQDQQ